MLNLKVSSKNQRKQADRSSEFLLGAKTKTLSSSRPLLSQEFADHIFILNLLIQNRLHLPKGEYLYFLWNLKVPSLLCNTELYRKKSEGWVVTLNFSEQLKNFIRKPMSLLKGKMIYRQLHRCFPS